MKSTLTSGTQKMQLMTTFTLGQGWMTQRLDLWKGEWEQGALSSQTWFSSEMECELDLQQRKAEFLLTGWQEL